MGCLLTGMHFHVRIQVLRGAGRVDSQVECDGERRTGMMKVTDEEVDERGRRRILIDDTSMRLLQ